MINWNGTNEQLIFYIIIRDTLCTLSLCSVSVWTIVLFVYIKLMINLICVMWGTITYSECSSKHANGTKTVISVLSLSFSTSLCQIAYVSCFVFYFDSPCLMSVYLVLRPLVSLCLISSSCVSTCSLMFLPVCMSSSARCCLVPLRSVCVCVSLHASRP